MNTNRFNYQSHLAVAFLVLLVFLAACKSGQPTQVGSYRQLYDYDSQAMHPEYLVYHHADDSSTIYFKIKSGNLLYTRQGAGAPFQANVKLQLLAVDRLTQKIDTTELNFTDSEQKTDEYLLASMKFPLAEGNFNLIINFNDVNRNASQTHFLAADKRNKYTAQNFLLLDEKTNEPCFPGICKTGAIIKLQSERNKNALDRISIYRMNGEIKLPPPPFSANQPELPSFDNSTVVPKEIVENTSIVFVAETGVYFATADPEKKNGNAFYTTSEFYPSIKHTDQLPWPLRYITTKAEYDEIVKSNYSKALIDNFWLECAGNKDRARDLIRIYYNRVEEANFFFSNYTEGWRTDRGMMHIVFGNPNKIIKQEDSETWIYGEEGQIGVLSFGFKKITNPYSENVFILNRDALFKTHWERMVTTWRNGKIFNE